MLQAPLLHPLISLPNVNQPPATLRVRRTIGLCQSHETLRYIFSTNNANGYKTYINYASTTSVPTFPTTLPERNIHPSAAAFHPRK